MVAKISTEEANKIRYGQNIINFDYPGINLFFDDTDNKLKILIRNRQTGQDEILSEEDTLCFLIQKTGLCQSPALSMTGCKSCGRLFKQINE